LAVEAGQSLLHYRLIEKIGEGGMGVVWKAVDTNLDRPVALKILPEEFAGNLERLARFEREAKLLASLDHRNIAAIFGLEEADGLHFLVMELVAGESLAARLQRGPIAVEETLGICGQIARALAAAHDSGVVHRDLKPGNVHVSEDGRVKVLDFGLAKALGDGTTSGDPELSPTVAGSVTTAGTILGTAAYMSPEQARGQSLDKRTDVWSFGCVLYECLTGRGVFGAETFSDTLASILTTEPDWSALPARTPARVRDLLERCLVKDFRERLRDAGDARLELDRARSERSGSVSGAPAAPVPAPRLRINLALAAVSLLAGIVLGIGLWAGIFGAGEDRPMETTPVSLSITFPDDQIIGYATLSPDGSIIVYRARTESPSDPEDRRWRMYVRSLSGYEPLVLEDVYGVGGFAFSPDSRWLAYVGTESADSATRRLFKVPLDGSAPPLVLADWRDSWGRGLLWPEMGHLVTLSDSPPKVVRIAADGSGVKAETDIPPERLEGAMSMYQLLPDGRHALCGVVEHGKGWLLHVALFDLETGTARIIIEDGDSPHWFSTGHLLFTRHDTLLAVPFDHESLEVTGGPVAIARGLRVSNVYSGASFDLSSNGTLMYAPGGVMGARRRLAYLNPDGTTEDWFPQRRAISEGPVVSDDEQRLAVTVVRESGLDEVWVADTEHRALRRLAAEPGMDCDPGAFSPGGDRLAYKCNTSDHAVIYIRSFDGSGEAEQLVESEGRSLWPVGFLPDESKLLYRWATEGRVELRAVDVDPSIDGDRKTMRLLPEVGSVELSPDRRWILYGSKMTGAYESYVRFLAGDGTLGRELPLTLPLTTIDIDGGYGWLRPPGEDGPELLFEDSDHRAYAVAVGVSALSRPRPLPWSIPVQALRETADYAMLRDGRYLVILKGEEEKPLREYRVVLNWAEVLRR